jgi:hypothetical protein
MLKFIAGFIRCSKISPDWRNYIACQFAIFFLILLPAKPGKVYSLQECTFGAGSQHK